MKLEHIFCVGLLVALSILAIEARQRQTPDPPIAPVTGPAPQAPMGVNDYISRKYGV